MTSAAIGVVGFGRCGTSLVMRMLEAGGVQPCPGSSERAYELAGGLADFPAYPTDSLEGRAVKLLDYPCYFDGLPDVEWRFVWIDRDHQQQALSQIKFLRGVAGVDVAFSRWPELAATYGRDRASTLDWYRDRSTQLTTLRFERILSNPDLAASRLADLVDGPFDVAAATAVVDVTRSPDCAPDLAFEMGISA